VSLWDQLNDDERETLVLEVVSGVAAFNVPKHLREGLVRYFSDGILPGGFMQAVLCNDLAQAVARADPLSFIGLRHIVAFLEQCAPAQAWGSREAVLTWTTTPNRLEV
jgi:hypothetical protein